MSQATRSPAATLVRKATKIPRMPTVSCARDENSASNSRSRNLKRAMRPPHAEQSSQRTFSPVPAHGWDHGPVLALPSFCAHQVQRSSATHFAPWLPSRFSRHATRGRHLSGCGAGARMLVCRPTEEIYGSAMSPSTLTRATGWRAMRDWISHKLRENDDLRSGALEKRRRPRRPLNRYAQPA
jgi:hypothetical protein